MSKKSSSPARNPARSRSDGTVVVGDVSHEALEAEWLADFRSEFPQDGRPDGPGWYTVAEMAEDAKCGHETIRRYINRCPAGYWEMVVSFRGQPRRQARFYRVAKAGRS